MIDAAVATTLGRHRERQEDRGGELGTRVYGVFDGMGSYGNGAQAAVAAFEGACGFGTPDAVRQRLERANTCVQMALRGAQGGTTGTGARGRLAGVPIPRVEADRAHHRPQSGLAEREGVPTRRVS